jgi:hypothetical protein
MERIINALLKGIQKLGLEAVIAPQAATANRPRIELYLAGIEPAGTDSKHPEKGKLGWERIMFNAVFSSGGTHLRWVTDTIIALRKLLPLEDKLMSLSVYRKTENDILLNACWRRLSTGRFEYPEEEQSSMPVRYTEQWEVSVSYPAHIIGQGPGEEL